MLVQGCLNLALLSHWAIANGFKINTFKCHSMIFATEMSSVHDLLIFEPQKSIKYLRVCVDQNLHKWAMPKGKVLLLGLYSYASECIATCQLEL